MIKKIKKQFVSKNLFTFHIVVVIFVIFSEFELLRGSWGAILIHGQVCDPEKEAKDSPRYVGCGALRLLTCKKPGGDTAATCACQSENLSWDPNSVRTELDPKKKLTMKLKRILRTDNATQLGRCRIRFGEACNYDDECFTGLNCVNLGHIKSCAKP